MCGDFNAIRCVEERRSVSSVLPQAGTDNFNVFIANNLLVDLPLRGRTYMWYRGDGRSMSHIDHFLLSENWCLTWSNCIQMAVSRGLSDHCPFGCLALFDLLVFFVNYIKNTLKLLRFGKNKITDSNIENITNILKS